MESYIWLILAAVMGVAEMMSLTLITIWFVLGGIAAFVAAFLGFDLAVQIGVFVAVSLLCLVLFRPLALKFRAQGQSHEPTVVGKTATVVETVGPSNQVGRVETSDHMTWSAKSADDSELEVGTRVKIVAQKSITLIVERVSV